MLNQEIKNGIKILCDKYSYNLFYEKNEVKISNSKNEISLNQTKNNEYEVFYNVANDYDKINVNQDEIFDVLISVFLRKDNEKIEKNPNDIINLEILNEYEYYDKYTLQNNLKEIIDSDLIHKNIGGNRILHEYYKGYLILMDDFVGSFKSNIIRVI